MLISKFNNKNIEQHIAGFEEKYHFKFPDVYRRFLRKYNGGQTPDTKFKLKGVSSDLSGFYGFGDAEALFNYTKLEDLIAIADFINDCVIPIANNSFGDLILIGIGPNNDETIYFLYHDRPKSYKILSKNFERFVRNCKSEEIGYIRTIEERKQGMIDNGLGHLISPEFIQDWQEEINRYGNIEQETLELN